MPICLDDRLLDGIIAGICDRDLAGRIQALDTSPSLQQVANMCRSHKAALKSNSELVLSYLRNKGNKLTKYRERQSLFRQEVIRTSQQAQKDHHVLGVVTNLATQKENAQPMSQDWPFCQHLSRW